MCEQKLSNDEIAAQLTISTNTARRHVRHMPMQRGLVE